MATLAKYNIFEYYRGNERHNEDSKHKALENNVTKAFINVLELCPSVGTQFIQWLSEEINVRLEPPKIEDHRILGGLTPEQVESTKTKIMLGIKRHNSPDFEKKKSRKHDSCMYDGALVGQGWLVAIESKLHGGMDKKQFNDELDKLGNGTRKKIKSWSEIHDFFRDLAEGKRGFECEPADKLLIGQFTEYLKRIGQLPFQGFENRHFVLFAKDKEQWEDKEREELKDLMNTLDGDLHFYKYGDETELNSLYWDYDPVKGLRRKNNPPDVELIFYQEHQEDREEPIYVDIQITRYQKEEPNLSVFAYVTTEEALRSLSRRIGKYRDKLLNEMRKRKADLAGYYVEMGDHNEDNLLQGNTGYCMGHITKKQLKAIEATLLHNAANKEAWFALGRYFEKDEITKPQVNGEDQLGKIAEAMRTLYPFVQFATKGKRWGKIKWR